MSADACCSGAVGPWIDDLDTAILEVSHIAGCDGGVFRLGDCGDLGVENAYWPTCRSSCDSDDGINLGGGRIEAQDTVSEFPLENGVDRRFKDIATFPWIHDSNAISKLGLADGRQKDLASMLGVEPCHDPAVGARAQKFRNDVGIENDQTDSIETRRFAHLLARRNFKLYTAQRFDMTPDRCGESTFVGTFDQGLTKNVPHFLFHGTIMLCCANAQALL